MIDPGLCNRSTSERPHHDPPPLLSCPLTRTKSKGLTVGCHWLPFCSETEICPIKKSHITMTVSDLKRLIKSQMSEPPTHLMNL